MLDYIIQDLLEHFSEHSDKIAALSRIIPAFILQTEWPDILPAEHKYQKLLDLITAARGEFDLWRSKWLSHQDHSTNIKTAIVALRYCAKTMYPNIHNYLVAGFSNSTGVYYRTKRVF